MLPLLIASVLTAGGFEAGGRIGVAFPSSGLENTHDAAATFGATVGYRAGQNRLMLDYGYTGLRAKQASSYQFNVHDILVSYGHEFVLGRSASASSSNWGIEASASAGLGLLSRTFGSAGETGRSPSGMIGVGFYQLQGHSRLSFGIDNLLFGESRPVGNTSSVSLTYMLALKGGVAYVF